jgi:hypothetical protein
MEVILLAITVVSLVVALVMSLAAWRLTRDEKRRASARVAALSIAASAGDDAPAVTERREPAATSAPAPEPVAPKPRAPWAPAPVAATVDAPVIARPAAADLLLNQAREAEWTAAAPSPHASGFLGETPVERDSDSRQRSLAFAAVFLFFVLSGGLMWLMSGPEGTSAVAVGPNSPLELLSMSHARQDAKLSVSGLVRNPASGSPIESLSAVVFLFDRTGTFLASSKAHVDFLRLGAGDESPFVVSLDAPPTVARYRVSFRTDDGVVPHVDRRGASPLPAEGEQAVTVSMK